MKIKNFKNLFVVFYLAVLVIFSYTIDTTICTDNLELIEGDIQSNYTESHDSKGMLKDVIELNKGNNDTDISDKLVNKEAKSSTDSSLAENITIDTKNDSERENSAEQDTNNDAQNNINTLNSEDNTKLNEENTNGQNSDVISDNNEDSEDLYKDNGAFEEENQEIFKEVESVLDKHEDSQSSSTTGSDWEKNISDFEPAEMLTLEINSEKELLFDPITEIPSHIKLAFVVNEEDTNIDFNIINPQQEIIYTAIAKGHLFYDFIADTKGEYIFSLDSRMNKNKVKVTFAIHQGNSTNTILSHENLQSVWDKITLINKSLKSSKFTAGLLSKKYDAHWEFAEKHNRQITFMSLVETTLLILIFFFQLFYIKRLASNIN